MKNDLIGRGMALVVVLMIVACIMHPSLWIGAFGAILNILIWVLLAKIVCRLVFKKSIRELILGEKDDD